MNHWGGRFGLVTGASAGIGAAICRELVRRGMIVFGCARNVEKIENIAKQEASLKSRGRLIPVKCDMTIESDIIQMHDLIDRTTGVLDLCINNAMESIDSPLMNGNTKDWKYMLELGVLGMCINTREAISRMEINAIDDECQIIQIGSIACHKLQYFRKPPENTPTAWFHNMYNGTKFMNRILMETLKNEVIVNGANIHLATISPGPVETELFARGTSQEIAEAFFRAHKCLQPQDVVDAVVHILSKREYATIHDLILEPVDFTI